MMADCPVCRSKGTLKVTSKTEEIPYFGEILESTVQCSQCGYKHSDTICLDQKEPVRYTLKVHKEMMNARIVKSPSATVTIPELGLKVEPGPKSQGYVSNVEGVLNRFEEAVVRALKMSEEETIRENALRILEDIVKVKSGEKSATIILEDPFGHSMIDHKEAEHRKLSENEIKNLRTGFATIEK
ncbi:ZPR1 zinc finger domain-containing protein [Methanobacterium aggregans]|uniref:ZPR1 zinc finger domain-containing protein n=1 Tax=Methanobacterium aggregans TaxID=1615586 RepID=UPI00315AAC98